VSPKSGGGTGVVLVVFRCYARVMTTRVDINELADLAEFLAHLQAGEVVELTRDGEVLAVATPSPVPDNASIPDTASPKRERQLGIWDHLNLDLPEDLFIGPDPETLAAVDGPIFPTDDEAAA